MGTDNDSLIEGLKGKCQKGDTIATKNPAYFCDFKSQIAFNNYNSAICIYTGMQAEERIKEADISQEKTANLNPDKPPGVPKNKKAGVQAAEASYASNQNTTGFSMTVTSPNRWAVRKLTE
jgi:hypothetical protein